MARYKTRVTAIVTYFEDKVYIVEANSEEEARELALENFDDYIHDDTRAINLESGHEDPIATIEDVEGE